MTTEVDNNKKREFCAVVNEMRSGMSSVRELISSLREKSAQENLDTRDGISLLSLKPQLMLSYLTSLTLLSTSRALGASITDHDPPSLPFSNQRRSARGNDAGDFVDAMVEGRVVLEKIRALEGRMRYQIEKLVRLAKEAPNQTNDVVDDPLAFRPNPQALMDDASDDDDGDKSANEDGAEREQGDGIYRPPKLAPVPYTEAPPPGKGKDKKERRRQMPTALTSLAHLDPSRPHAESTSGLGAAPAANMELATSRMRELKRMTEFEEENFTRLVMKKRDMKQRLRDEADMALGGVPTMAKGGRRRGGLEDEFGDILRSVGRNKRAEGGDGYEELRMRGKKEGVLERSRKRDVPDVRADEGPRVRKKTRFDREAMAMKRRSAAKRR